MHSENEETGALNSEKNSTGTYYEAIKNEYL